MARVSSALRAADLGLQNEGEEPLDGERDWEKMKLSGS